MAQATKMAFELWTRLGPRKHMLHEGLHWRHLA